MPSSARGKKYLFMRGDEGIAPYIIQFKRLDKLPFVYFSRKRARNARVSSRCGSPKIASGLPCSQTTPLSM